MTDEQVMYELKQDSTLNKVRQKMSSFSAKMEQAFQQRTVPGPIEVRRMEFEAAQEVIEIVELAH